jgi:hypothetical protein
MRPFVERHSPSGGSRQGDLFLRGASFELQLIALPADEMNALGLLVFIFIGLGAPSCRGNRSVVFAQLTKL